MTHFLMTIFVILYSFTAFSSSKEYYQIEILEAVNESGNCGTNELIYPQHTPSRWTDLKEAKVLFKKFCKAIKDDIAITSGSCSSGKGKELKLNGFFTVIIRKAKLVRRTNPDVNNVDIPWASEDVLKNCK